MLKNFKSNVVNSLIAKYESKLSKYTAELEVYLENPVGVGEHGDIVEVVEEKLKQIDSAKSMLETLQNTFTVSSESVEEK